MHFLLVSIYCRDIILVYNGHTKKTKTINNFSKKTMSDQRDNIKNMQKIGGGHLGQDHVFNQKELANKEAYSLVFKKTEKIVTALYLVTDCMDSDDAIKMKMRSRSVDLLGSVHQIPVLSPVERHSSIVTVRSQLDELVSLVEIASSVGYISEMNANILKREFLILVSEIEACQAGSGDIHKAISLYENSKISDFVLSPEMFEVEGSRALSLGADNAIKNQNKGFGDKGHLVKKTGSFHPQHMNVLIGRNIPHGADLNSGQSENTVSKKERSEIIKNIIKDKIEVSIKDISVAFKDCSEKTIQRELNDLISKGQIKKIGEKRWSKYQLVASN